MRLDPVQVTGLSYTIEMRIRITKCNMEEVKNDSFPLTLQVRTRGLCNTQVNFGQRGQKALLQATSGEREAKLHAEGLIHGEWYTMRLVVSGGVNSAQSRIFINGNKLLDASDAEIQEHEWFHIRSDGDNNAWEIDYILWKNEALEISIPLERPAAPKRPIPLI